MKRIDPRGPRFGAAITSGVLAVALVLPFPWGIVAAAVQWIAFGLGAFAGPAFQPWGIVYRLLVRPRLSPPGETEDARAPRFAQLVGFAFLTAALIGCLAGLPVVYYFAVGAALVAALLNAVFDLCLGCEMYVRIQRLRKHPIDPLRQPV